MIKIKRICHTFFWLLYLIDGGVWSLRNLSISVPRAVLSSSGEATFRCSYDLEGAPLYSIRWYRGETEFYRYVPREMPPTMVFPLPGASVDLAQSDDKQVRVVNLSRMLSGDYQCEVSADAPLFHTDIRRAPLSIIDPPFRAPQLSVSRSSYSRGDVISANCTVDSAYPQPSIAWTANGRKIAEWSPRPTVQQDFKERGSFSQLEITLSDPKSYSSELSEAILQDSEENSLRSDVDILRYTMSPPAHGSISLGCAADILQAYTRQATPRTLHEDKPRPASRTRDDNAGSLTVSKASLSLGAILLYYLL